MQKNKWAIGLLSGALVMAGSAASATTLEKLKFDEIVMKSSACVVGEVVSVEYGQDAAGTYTLTTFNVTNAAFGDVGNTLTVRSDGGRVKRGKLSMVEVNAGSPQFFVGQQSMLFVAGGESGALSVVGYNQGMFPVRQEAQGAMVALPDSFGGLSSVSKVLDRARNRRSGGAVQDVAQ